MPVKNSTNLLQIVITYQKSASKKHIATEKRTNRAKIIEKYRLPRAGPRVPLARTRYRKIPKISPGAYIFQRPLLRGLFLEGLIFGGAYVRREICVSKSIGLALFLEGNLPFFFVLLCI